jgi:hypothetical protein
MKADLLKDTLDRMLQQTEQGMDEFDYTPKKKDITVNEDGEKTYTQEWLDNMPTPLAMGVGRHAAILDMLDMIDTHETISQSLSGLKEEIMDEHSSIDPTHAQNDWENNPRFSIKFDEEDDGLVNN